MVTDADVMALVDRDALRRYLAAGLSLEGPLELQVLSGGRSNLTYLVRVGDRDLVVRRRPIGAVPAGAHDMAREHRVLAALGGTGLPVPLVHAYCDDESIVGAPFYVMDRVVGRVFHRGSDVVDLSEDQALAVSLAAVDVLGRLHAVDYADVGLAELGRPEGFVARRIGRWLEQWHRSEHRDHPLVDTLGAALASAVPSQASSTLIHGDYRLGNLLISLDGGAHVAAVLDWEMSTLGDPLTDLAHLMVYWDSPSGRRTHESQTIAEHPGFPDSAALAAHYGAATGRDLTDLDFYLAFEHWRAAIIKEGIFVRTRRGDHPEEDADDLGDTVGRHLEEAEDIMRRRAALDGTVT